MSPETANSRGNGAVLEKINFLISTMSELKTSINNLNTEITNLRVVYEREHVRLVDQVTSAHKRIDALDETIKCMEGKIDLIEDAVHPLKTQSKILAWVGGAFGMLIVALIWAVLTHSIELVR